MVRRVEIGEGILDPYRFSIIIEVYNLIYLDISYCEATFFDPKFPKILRGCAYDGSAKRGLEDAVGLCPYHSHR